MAWHSLSGGKWVRYYGYGMPEAMERQRRVRGNICMARRKNAEILMISSNLIIIRTLSCNAFVLTPVWDKISARRMRNYNLIRPHYSHRHCSGLSPCNAAILRDLITTSTPWTSFYGGTGDYGATKFYRSKKEETYLQEVRMQSDSRFETVAWSDNSWQGPTVKKVWSLICLIFHDYHGSTHFGAWSLWNHKLLTLHTLSGGPGPRFLSLRA